MSDDTTKTTNSEHGNVLAIAADAFKALEGASKLDGKGRQMLAYCIMVQHSDDVRDDRKPPALSQLKVSPKAAREYNGRLAELFIGKRPEPTKEKTDAAIRAAKLYTARYAHMQRAISLAGDLQGAGVGIVSFDLKASMFRVSSAVLCDPNMEPVGSLAKAKTVLIDGTAYMVERGGKVISIHASLTRIADAASAKRSAASPKATTATPDAPSNGASDTATTGGASAAVIVTKLDTFSMDALLVRAAKIANEPSDGELRRAMLTDEAWNALSDLVAFYQEIEKNEANAKATPAPVKIAA
jgi:hypothetical protein